MVKVEVQETHEPLSWVREIFFTQVYFKTFRRVRRVDKTWNKSRIVIMRTGIVKLLVNGVILFDFVGFSNHP